MASKGITYADSGVDIDREEEAISSLVTTLAFKREGMGAPFSLPGHFTGGAGTGAGTGTRAGGCMATGTGATGSGAATGDCASILILMPPTRSFPNITSGSTYNVTSLPGQVLVSSP